MKCPYCGKELSAEANFCPKCGQKQPKAEANSSLKAKAPSGGKKWLIPLIIVVAAAAVIIPVVLLTLRSQSTPAKQAGESLKNQLEAGGETLNSEDSGTRIAELIYQNASWEIKSVKNGTAAIAVSAPDFYMLYKDLTKNAVIPKDAEEYKALMDDLEASLEKALSQSKYTKRKQEISVPVADDGTITITYEFADALYGGLLTLTEELREAYMGGENE